MLARKAYIIKLKFRNLISNSLTTLIRYRLKTILVIRLHNDLPATPN